MQQPPFSLKLIQFEMICSIRTDGQKAKIAYATVLTCLKLEVIINQSIHWHEQNAVIPCRSQEPPAFLPIIHFFLPLLSANHSSILPHVIQPSISWYTSWSYCFQIHVQYSFGNPIFFHSLYMSKPT